jgi:hypothetical protein
MQDNLHAFLYANFYLFRSDKPELAGEAELHDISPAYIVCLPGQRFHPSAKVNCVRQLISPDYVIWLCTYVRA